MCDEEHRKWSTHPPPDLTRHRNPNYPFFMMAQSSPQRLARLRGTSQNRLPSPSSSSHAASSREASTSHVPSSQTKTDIPPNPRVPFAGPTTVRLIQQRMLGSHPFLLHPSYGTWLKPGSLDKHHACLRTPSGLAGTRRLRASVFCLPVVEVAQGRTMMLARR